MAHLTKLFKAFKEFKSIPQNNDNWIYTCNLTQGENQDNNGDTEEFFSTISQCSLPTGEITSYLNNNKVDETNNSDEDTLANASNNISSDIMLNHLEDHIKRAIKTQLFKRYESNQVIKYQYLSINIFSDPRYRNHYIEFPQKNFIISLIKQEMDDIGQQMKVDEHDKNTNIGGWSNNYWNNKQNNVSN